jgi:ubiquitin-protein ligase
MNKVINNLNLSGFTRKRIVGDTKLLINEPVENIKVYYYDNNILEWFFLINGLDEDYKGGEYIARMVFDSEYPKTPPEFYVLTPNGRFDAGQKICLSNSKYHKYEWNPLWNIHAILKGFLSIFVEDKDSGISHIKTAPEIRQKMAKESIKWNLNYGKKNNDLYNLLKTKYIGYDSEKKENSDNESEKSNEESDEESDKESNKDSDKESNEESDEKSDEDEKPKKKLKKKQNKSNLSKFEELAKKDKKYKKMLDKFKQDMKTLKN